MHDLDRRPAWEAGVSCELAGLGYARGAQGMALFQAIELSCERPFRAPKGQALDARGGVHRMRDSTNQAGTLYVRTYVRYVHVMNATKLRAELYSVLDSVLETGKPVIIERKGRRLRLSLDHAPRRRAARTWPDAHPEWVNGSVDDLVHIDWSKEWRP